MSTFGMVGKFEVDPQNREALLAILAEAAAMMNARDDCQLYTVSTDADDAGKVWVMELWTTKAAHDAALTVPRVRELIGQAMPLLTAQPDGASLIPVSGAPKTS